MTEKRKDWLWWWFNHRSLYRKDHEIEAKLCVFWEFVLSISPKRTSLPLFSSHSVYSFLHSLPYFRFQWFLPSYHHSIDKLTRVLFTEQLVTPKTDSHEKIQWTIKKLNKVSEKWFKNRTRTSDDKSSWKKYVCTFAGIRSYQFSRILTSKELSRSKAPTIKPALNCILTRFFASYKLQRETRKDSQRLSLMVEIICGCEERGTECFEFLL